MYIYISVYIITKLDIYFIPTKNLNLKFHFRNMIIIIDNKQHYLIR